MGGQVPQMVLFQVAFGGITSQSDRVVLVKKLVQMPTNIHRQSHLWVVHPTVKLPAAECMSPARHGEGSGSSTTPAPSTEAKSARGRCPSRES